MAFAASIFRNATKASPALSRALEIVAAASASPSARMMAARFSWVAYAERQGSAANLKSEGQHTFSTTNLALSASKE
jgi:hypothetical protein